MRVLRKYAIRQRDNAVKRVRMDQVGLHLDHHAVVAAVKPFHLALAVLRQLETTVRETSRMRGRASSAARISLKMCEAEADG